MCTPFRQTTDLRQDPFFIGRSAELHQIITNLLQNRHTLITGDRGIGKTRLMQEALSILNGTVHHIDLAKLPRSSERGLCIYIDSLETRPKSPTTKSTKIFHEGHEGLYSFIALSLCSLRPFFVTFVVKWFCGGFSARLLARPRERPEIALFYLPSNAKGGKSCNRSPIL